MKTKDAPSLNMFAAENGIVVRVGYDDYRQGELVTKDKTYVFNEIKDLFEYIEDHFKEA